MKNFLFKVTSSDQNLLYLTEIMLNLIACYNKWATLYTPNGQLNNPFGSVFKIIFAIENFRKYYFNYKNVPFKYYINKYIEYLNYII